MVNMWIVHFASLVADSRVRHQDLLPDVKHVKARSHQLYPRLVRTSVDLRLAADAGLSKHVWRRPVLAPCFGGKSLNKFIYNF